MSYNGYDLQTFPLIPKVAFQSADCVFRCMEVLTFGVIHFTYFYFCCLCFR